MKLHFQCTTYIKYTLSCKIIKYKTEMSYPSVLTLSVTAASSPCSRGQKVSLKIDNRLHYICHFYPSPCNRTGTTQALGVHQQRLLRKALGSTVRHMLFSCENKVKTTKAKRETWKRLGETEDS